MAGKQLIAWKVDADTKRMTRHLSDLQRRVIPQVTMRALNKAAAQYKTAASRAIAQRTGIKVGLIKKRMVVRKANKANLSAHVLALLLRVLAKHLGKPRKSGTGTKVGKFVFPNPSFVQTMPSGKILSLHRNSSKRYPITEDGVIIDPPFQSVMNRELRATATPVFLKEFQRLLKLKLKN